MPVKEDVAPRQRLAIAAVIYNPTKLEVGPLKAAVEAAEARRGWGKTRCFETSKSDARMRRPAATATS